MDLTNSNELKRSITRNQGVNHLNYCHPIQKPSANDHLSDHH